MPDMKKKYVEEVRSALAAKLGITNAMEIPKLEKIVVNMGVGEAAQDSKQLDAAMNDMRIITGQQPCITRAKKSIAGFKIREAQLQKIPYMIVVGDKEEEQGIIALRSRSEGDLGQTTLDEFIAKLKTEIAEKK